MTRNLKALGLALAATFALGAVAASTATAQSEGHFFSHSENAKTHLEGQQEGETTENVFTIIEKNTELTVECPSEGTTYIGTGDESTATSVTVHPVYANEEKTCPVKINGFNFGKAVIHTEGCNYVLGANTDANGHAAVHIECDSTGEGEETEKHEITITGPLGCTIHVGEQTPERGVHYTDHGGSTESGEQAITIDATVEAIKYDETGCPGIEDNGFATYDSAITLKGYEDNIDEEGPTKGDQVSIAWTEIPPTEGHFFSHSENGKTHLEGVQEGEENVFTIAEGENTITVECPNEGTTYIGTADESTSTSATVHPTYANEEKVCTTKVNGFSFGKAVIHTEGCNYVLDADTDANEHAPVHVECNITGEEQHEITITGPLGCTIHVGEQTPDGGVHYNDDGGSTESGEQAVTVEATVTDIDYTATSCPWV